MGDDEHPILDLSHVQILTDVKTRVRFWTRIARSGPIQIWNLCISFRSCR